LALPLPILLQVAQKILASLVARFHQATGTAGKTLELAAALDPRNDVSVNWFVKRQWCDTRENSPLGFKGRQLGDVDAILLA
jgi:hypothetical protein